MSIDQGNFRELSIELLDSGSKLRFIAHGDSMNPFIQDGNILVTESLKNTSASIGDVIFFRRSGSDNAFTAHRLIKFDQRHCLLTKGDDLGYYDSPVTPDLILGRVVQVERGRKRLVLTSGLWRIFGLLIACFARGRYYNQGRVVRNLGRLWWLMGGRRIK
jgi:hypothetical protein